MTRFKKFNSRAAQQLWWDLQRLHCNDLIQGRIPQFDKGVNTAAHGELGAAGLIRLDGTQGAFWVFTEEGKRAALEEYGREELTGNVNW